MSTALSLPAGINPADAAKMLARLDPKWQGGKSELSEGIRAGYAIMGYRGKVWAVSHNGEVRQVLRPDTPPGAPPEPAGSIEVVLVRSATALSKTFYAGKWADGSTEAPDCSSINGVVPDAGVKAKQSDTCALCPQNQWGSHINELGNKVKACRDAKRIAIVPLQDIPNEAFGGPMLLRIPPDSLKSAAAYGGMLAQSGLPDYAMATRISFDPSESHPKMIFTPIRVLSPDEFQQIVALREDHRTNNILFNQATVPDAASVPASPPAQTAPAIQPPPPAATPAPPPVATPTPPPPVVAAPPPPPPAPAPEPEPEPEWQFSADGAYRWRPGMPAWELVPAAPAPAAPAPVQAAPAPAPAPEPEPEPEPEWQFSADGAYRWRPGMTEWELVPTSTATTQPAAQAAPAADAANLDDLLDQLGGVQAPA